MKKITLPLLLLFIFGSLFAQKTSVNNAPVNVITQSTKQYQDGKIWFQVKLDYNNPIIKTGEENNIQLNRLPFLSGISASFHITNLSAPFIAAKTSDVLQRTYQLEFSDYAAADKIIKLLQACPEIEFAEHVPYDQICLTPNDYSSTNQWFLQKINATGAWNYFSTGSTRKVAIVDNSVQRNHTDLSANIWVNPGEIASNGIDDDANGYIDDVNGYDVADLDNNPDPPNTTFDHGTHCAGDASAVTNNGTGVAGIGWSLKIVAVKAETNAGGPSSISNGYQGITYAAVVHADVISLSWGGTGSSVAAQNVINYAWSQGCIIVAAAGNSNVNTMFYPAAYTNVLSVASTGTTDAKSSFSNYGTWVDVSSPGENILSTIPTSTYGLMSGTSMATPVCAGLLGLMKSLNGTLTQSQLINCLTSTCDNINAQNPSYIGQLGSGRINANNAMACIAATLNSPPVSNFIASPLLSCTGTPVQYTDQSTFNPTSWAWTFPGGTPGTSSLQNPTVTYASPGTYSATLIASNGNGPNSFTRTNYITISNSTQTLPFVEGFQLTPFLPANWAAKDANNDGIFWTRNATVGGFSTSTACSNFDNYNNDVAGGRDEMWSPKFNLTTLSTCSLKFDVAYAKWNNNYTDTLQVLVSTNCGQTWTQIYMKGGNTLATAPADSVSAFVPTSTQWRTETINLNTYVTASSFMVSFKNRGHYGQLLYIDNINIAGAPASGPPTAAFTASQTNFCRNTCIGFTDNSINAPTSWAWTFPGGTPGTSTSQNPTNICFNTAGTYTISLVATNSNGNSTATQVITVNPLPVVTIAPAAPGVCAGSNVSLTANGATTYAWAPATGLSATTGATVVCTPTATTTYTITGTNATGCTSTTTVTVTYNTLPTVTHTPALPTYCTGGSSSITASGGTTYVWAPASGLSATTGATVTANPTTTTTYTITGTNAAGCTNTNTVTVTVNTSPTVGITPSAPNYCTGGSVSITASGATTYAWAPATGLSATTGATVTANPTTTTTYTVTGTNAAGCTNTSTVTVTVNTAPTITHTPASPTYCNGSSVSITANGGNTYAWAPATGLSATTGATVTANPTATTTYTITGTAANGCTNTNTVTVTVNPLPNINFSPTAPSVCSGNAVSITASGAATYVWSPATGLSCTTCATVSANPTTTTTYTVTGTSAAGCVNTATVTVNISTSPTVNITPSAPSYCGGGSVSLTAGGATSYVWLPATGLSCTTCANPTANPTTTTTYTVTGTAASGCTNTSTVTVTVNPAPTVTHVPATPSYCGNGSVNITASGATTYVWAPATSLNSTTGTTVTANPTTTTTYTITGTAANGCTASNTVTVTVNPVPTVTKVPAAPTYCAGGNVSITANGASTYIWAPATGLSCTTCATVTASPTVTTTYTIMGTSAAGCTATTTVTVTVHPLPTANAGPNVTICSGDSATLTGTGGGTYAWAPATGLSCTTCASPFAFPTVTTNYTLTVTNGFGCTRTDQILVTVNPAGTPPTISQAGNVLTCNNGVTWQWYLNSVLIPGATNQTYAIIQSGTYTVCKTNSYGCITCSTGWSAIFTGIESDLTLGSLNIFPNPNNGIFDISFDILNKDNYTVELTNSLGQAVYNEALNGFNGHYSKHFDILQYGSGVYMFTLKNSSNQSVKKILVTK